MIRISQLRLTIDEPKEKLHELIINKLKINEEQLIDYKIYKESIDARKKDNLYFVYTVDCILRDEKAILNKKIKDISITPQLEYSYPAKGELELSTRPIVIGFGPAGMFSALLLAQMGYKPIVFERGQDVETRVKDIEQFWSEGILNEESNVQFGEGGAGTFSDGKLTTRVKDLRGRKVLEELVNAGAPDDILFEAHPHVGTDLLRNVVKKIRNNIIELGGEVHFNTKVSDLIIENHKIKGVVVNDNEKYMSEIVVLAIGHSARDTFKMLHKNKVEMTAKNFAIGARIEHPQFIIDQAQYKEYASNPRLGAAEYRLTHQTSNGRGVYTFCMCPGGVVVPSSSEKNKVVTNGMSYHARDKENANSALLVQVSTEDFGSDPLAGIRFQEELESKAYLLGGSNYQAPAQLVKDFLLNQPSTNLGDVKPSYQLGVQLTNLHDLFPSYVTESMVEGIKALGNKLKGFDMNDAILTGIESRTSSPIRIDREKDTYESINIKGLYPIGEGAGYAGGIVSAGIDGLACSEQIITKYRYTKEG